MTMIDRTATGSSNITRKSPCVRVPVPPTTPPVGGDEGMSVTCEDVRVVLGGEVVMPRASSHSLQGPGAYAGGARWI